MCAKDAVVVDSCHREGGSPARASKNATYDMTLAWLGENGPSRPFVTPAGMVRRPNGGPERRYSSCETIVPSQRRTVNDQFFVVASEFPAESLTPLVIVAV